MTHDLAEQELRALLTAAADGEEARYLDVDPATVLAHGRHALRRRRVALIGTVAAAALALGVGSAVVLSDRTGDDRSLPAMTSSVTGRHVTLELGSDPQSGSGEPLAAVVTLDEASSRVEFRLQTETGSVLNSQERTSSDQQAPWANLSDTVMVAVVPAEAAAFVPVWAGGVSQEETSVEELPDGRVAVAWRTNVPATTAQFAGVVWTDGTTAYTASGSPLPSVVADDIVFFANPNSGAMGYVRPESDSVSGSGAVGQAREMEAGQFAGVWSTDASGTSGVYGAYLPPISDERAGQITIETIAEATVRDVTSHNLGGSLGLLVIAHVDGPPDSVVSVTFPGSENEEKFMG